MRRMKLGQLLAAYQRQHKLTLHQFAREIGVDQMALWRLMRSRDKGETCKQWPAILRWVFGK